MEQLLLRKSQQSTDVGVGRGDASASQLQNQDSILGILSQHAVTEFTGRKGLASFHFSLNISPSSHQTRHPSKGIQQRPAEQGHPAILPLAGAQTHLDPRGREALGARQLGTTELGLIVRMDHREHQVANQLCRGPARQGEHRWGDPFDHSCGIGAHHNVQGVFGNQPVVRFALPEAGAGFLQVGDFSQLGQEVANLAGA